ncbi:MAG: lipoate--protein ligase family protein [Haloarculaceae archaeon]
MRVLRGREADVEADRERTAALFERARERREPAVRVWRPPRQVVFGRRDAHEDGYDEAVAAARAREFPAVERETGGRAVAYTGTTVAFCRFEPVDDEREGVHDRFERMADDVLAALGRLEVDASPGEPEASFCPGSHSLQADGKLVGLAQRIGGGVALTAGQLVVADRAAIASVLDPVYEALGVPFDPASVGSVEAAGGVTDPETVLASVERELVGDAEVEPAYV